MTTLTLDTLLTPRPKLNGGDAPGRIRLMRHAFRGHKAQLEKLEKWTQGVRLTEAQAYPPASRPTLGTPSAKDVLNAVRLNRRLARLVSSDQSDGLLHTGDLILAFAATGGPSAEFLAAFEVADPVDWATYFQDYHDLLQRPPLSARSAGLQTTWLASGLGYNALPTEGPRLNHLIDRPDVLEGLERRLVVEWRSGVSWFQKDLHKEVLEIRPQGFVREFTGLLDFTLSFDELRAIVGIEDTDTKRTTPLSGDPIWRDQLQRVRGVYIVQSEEGPLYVGAAYNTRGFLGRWTEYARTHEVSSGPNDEAGLRSNVGVRAFLNADGDPAVQRRRLLGLRFSIAHVMDRSARAADVLDMERWFKNKLGTRANPLDLNEN